MSADEKWSEILLEDFEGPIPPEGIKSTVQVPEEVYQFFLEYAKGRNRYIEDLKKQNYDYDTLLQRCAGSLQATDMQKTTLKLTVEALTEWQASAHVTTELSRKSIAIVKYAQTIMKAQYALGMEQAKTEFSKKGAEKRHEEHRAMKSDVFEWLDCNMNNFKSMDKAAEYISSKVVRVAFRTARAWVGEWKKLRAASKA